MIVTQVNPSWLELDRYVEFLNQGFAGHWDRASLQWHLRRVSQGRAADIAVRAHGSKVLAGITCCYRQLKYGSHEPVDVCVLGAGTTARGERGRGHYRHLLETSIDLCRRRACAAVLGFVTRENATGRGLLRLGARAIPSHYLVTERSGGKRLARRPPSTVHAATLEERRDDAGGDRVRFHYPRPHDWHSQFVGRPRPVTGLRLANDSWALVERVGRTDRLQWLACPAAKATGHVATLACASARAGRDFFMYTLDPLLAQGASRLGLRIRRGYLMVLPLDRASWLHSLPDAAWHVQSGDRL